MLKTIVCIGLGSLMILSSCTPGERARSGVPVAGPGTAETWSNHGGDTNETHYSRLDAINTTSIGRLGLAWSLDLPEETALAGTPLAVDGVLYFTGDHSVVYAVDAATGALLWKYDPELWKENPAGVGTNFAINRGPAYADGRLFAVLRDGHLFALDARTGQFLWRVQTFPPGEGRGQLTGAPRVFNGKVIIGQGGADRGQRGYVTAYDAVTGKQAWRFYVAPGSPEENKGDPVMERAAATWGPEFWKRGTGGGPWDSIVFDAELNRIYVATANPGGGWFEVEDDGRSDLLYTDSIVALDAETGRYVWHYQLNPNDIWDYDATQQMTLADLTIDGQRRKVLMQAPKNGFFYVIDRRTGRLLSAEKFSRVTWAERIDLTTGRPVEAPGVRAQIGVSEIWPGSAGAHSWQAMSFSPETGYVYIPTMQTGMRITRSAPSKPGQRGSVTASQVFADSQDGKGGLLAWDPQRQKQVWHVQHDTYFNGGTLATAGGLVFQGTADGYLSAYDAAIGKRLWRFYAGLAMISAPISYAVGGRQYISVLTGYGASAGTGSLTRVGWKYRTPRRLLTFSLDGQAKLPSVEKPDLNIEPLDDPAIEIKQADVAAGQRLYGRCMICHGSNLQSAGAAPDLRESPIALQFDAFWQVVHDGALLQNGMPGFNNLTREQTMQLFAYIRAGARKAIAESAAGTKPGAK